MPPPTLSYGLNFANKKGGPGKPGLAKPTAGQKRKKTIFDSDSDDDDDNATGDGEAGKSGNGAVEIATLGGLEPERDSTAFSKEADDQVEEQPASKRHASEKRSASGMAINAPCRKDASGNGKQNSYLNLSTQHASNKHAQTAESLDPTIYDYDAIYDSIHPPKQSSGAGGGSKNGNQTESKYMASLMRSAEVRKRDQLRARDKQLAREREAEGDEFADKEKFVTGAYKAQQEEARKIEAEEAEKEKEEEEKRKKGMGMASFYKDMLERDGQRHEEAMKAAEDATAKKQETGEAEDKMDTGPPQEKSAEQIAADLNARGAHIAVNDEGEVVDKRQLLSAGLNVSAKPKPKAAPEVEKSGVRAGVGRPSDRGGAAASARNMQRARQTEMLTAQLEERMKKEQEEEEARAKELAEKNKSKKTESDVMSAKERYLARKREREKEKEQSK